MADLCSLGLETYTSSNGESKGTGQDTRELEGDGQMPLSNWFQKLNHSVWLNMNEHPETMLLKDESNNAQVGINDFQIPIQPKRELLLHLVFVSILKCGYGA